MYGYQRVATAPESWPRQQMPDGQLAYYAGPAFNEKEKQLFFDRITNLKHGRWITVTHPGLAKPQRASVTELLCSPKAKKIVKMKNIQLVSFYDLWNEKFGKIKNR